MPFGIGSCFASATPPLSREFSSKTFKKNNASTSKTRSKTFYETPKNGNNVVTQPDELAHLSRESLDDSFCSENLESFPGLSSSPSSLVLALLTEELPATTHNSLESLSKETQKEAVSRREFRTSDSCWDCASGFCCTLWEGIRSISSSCQHFLETLHPFSDLSDHETSNYLYNRSREIEPKNCRKAPVKERRWPNIPLKSPGIKPRSNRSVPNPLPSMFGSGHKTDGGQEGEETPHHLTPPTPSTPGTPPASANPADNSIFATVEIGQGALAFGRHDYRGSISSASYQYNTSVPPTPVASNPPLPPPPYTPSSLSAGVPPPLPPRRKREPSVGDTSPKVKQAPDAPELPPRDASPPPIPPRAATTTLPRMHSSNTLSHASSATHHQCPPPQYPLHQHSSGSLASIPSSVYSGMTSSFHHLHLQPQHTHHTPTNTGIPFYHHNAPFCGAPPHLQYRLDPPPQRRRTSSMDLTSPVSVSHRATSNGPQSGVSSTLETTLGEAPPTPPPRLAARVPSAFTYDHHNL